MSKKIETTPQLVAQFVQEAAGLKFESDETRGIAALFQEAFEGGSDINLSEEEETAMCEALDLVEDRLSQLKKLTGIIRIQAEEVSMPEFDELDLESLEEGFVRGVAGDAKDAVSRDLKDAAQGIAVFFKNADARVRMVEEKMSDAKDYIQEHEFNGQTEGTGYLKIVTRQMIWRFYFLLDDSKFNATLGEIKAGKYKSPLLDFNVGTRNISLPFKAQDKKALLAVCDKYVARTKEILAAGRAAAEKDPKMAKSVKAFLGIAWAGAADLYMTIRRIMRYNQD